MTYALSTMLQGFEILRFTQNDIITLKCVNPVMLILELVVVAFPDLLNTIYLLRGLCKDIKKNYFMKYCS